MRISHSKLTNKLECSFPQCLSEESAKAEEEHVRDHDEVCDPRENTPTPATTSIATDRNDGNYVAGGGDSERGDRESRKWTVHVPGDS